MPRKAEVPKGEAFLPGVSAEELRTMLRRASSGIDAMMYIAMHMRKNGMEIAKIAEGTGSTAEAVRERLMLAHHKSIGSVPRVKKGLSCRLSAKQRGQPAHVIASTAPLDHGLEGGTWGYETVRLHIKKRFGVKYTYKGTHRPLWRMAFVAVASGPARPRSLGK